MLRNIKSLMIRMAGPMGGYRLAKRLTRYEPRLLMYHRFSEHLCSERVGQALFEKQMRLLQKNFNVLPLATVVRMLKGELPKEKDVVVITVDDGYDDFYLYAYPVLKKLGLPATVYATVDFVDKGLWLWPDYISYVLENTVSTEFVFDEQGSPRSFALSGADERGELKSFLGGYCLGLPTEQKWSFLKRFAETLDVMVPPAPTEEYRAVTWDALREMSSNGIEVGAHTCTHPALSNVKPENLDYEIVACKARLESQLGVTVDNFCYPNGQPADYNERVMNAVEQAGFASATVAFADGDPYKGMYELRRHGVGNNMFQFCKSIFGVERLGHKVKKMLK